MKKIFALILCLCLMVPLVACGGDPVDTNTATSSQSTQSSDTATGSEDSSDVVEPEAAPNLVLATDLYARRIILYDMDFLEPGVSLDLAEVWSYTVPFVANSPGLKYREDTVFGDVVVLAAGCIVSYPEGKTLWKTKNITNSPHSVELLPSGNMVVACSSGELRLYYTSEMLTGGDDQKYASFDLYDAHGVLWDPEYNVLWALGGHELVAYKVEGEGANETLVQMPGMGCTLPGDKGGHDLAPDYSDTQYLYFSIIEKVYRFDKETGEVDDKFQYYGKLQHDNIKGFGNNANGNFVYCYPNGGEGRKWERWEGAYCCTDTIWWVYKKSEKSMVVQSYQSETAAIYKVRIFDGRYQ